MTTPAVPEVFMTRTHDMVCIHEPFGDAFYYGPERMSMRYESDEKERVDSGFAESNYKSIFDRISKEGVKDKRIFIKDLIYYLFPPDQKPPRIAPSINTKKRGIGTEVNGVTQQSSTTKPPFPYDTQSESGNPTIVPEAMLREFHFTFLIRDPHSSIPSYYRCCIPPLDKVTGFYDYYPNEAGYDELRRFFDFLRESGQVGPGVARIASDTTNDDVNGNSDKDAQNIEICVVDADDLLDDPESIIRSYCNSVGLEYSPSMLQWGTEESQKQAEEAFAKWKGFHEDAIDSRDLKPRVHKKAAKTEEQWDAEWTKKFGPEAAKVIRETVDKNMEDYLYLKKFSLKA